MMDGGGAVLLALCGLSATKFSILLSLYKKRPRSAELVGHVSGITLYPIKSCRGIQLSEAECTFMGLRTTGGEPRSRDRHYMIATEDGNFLSMRKEPSMALITSIIDGKNLRIDAPGMDTLTMPIQMDVSDPKSIMRCSVWGDKFEGLDCGEEAARWASQYLKRPVRMLFSAEGIQKRELLNQGSSKWHRKARSWDVVAYPDFAPYMMMVESSVKDLNSRLEKPVMATNFRPNIMVKTNTDKPFDEDTWDQIYIGESGVKMNNLKPCDRCLLTTVDPVKGVKDPNQEPLKTLKTFRLFKDLSDAPLFGINLFADITGNIHVGDPVYVTRKK